MAQNTPNFNTEIPAKLITPDRVPTRLGTLEFFDGMPTEATASKVLEHLTFLRGVEAFLSAIPAASVEALREQIAKDVHKARRYFGLQERLGGSN